MVCENSPEREGISVKREYAVLAIIIGLAILLRLIRLGSFAFWADEAHNLVVSQDLYGAFFEGKLIANHPPLPYFLLAFWRAVGMGANEWTIRALPALFGMLGVVAMYGLGRELFGVRVGWTAALVLALSPFHVLHSQDLKEYIYLPFFIMVTAIFFWRAMMRDQWKDWIVYGLLAAVCCYTEAFVAPLLTTLNLFYLAQHFSCPQRLRKWFVANALGALLFLPWLGWMLHRVYTFMIAAEGWWVPHPTLWSFAFYFKTIAFGYAALKPWFHLAFLLFALLLLVGIFAAWQRNRKAAILLMLWATAPVAMVYALSFISQSIFLIRAFIPYSMAVYLLIAVGLASLKPRALYVAAITVLIVLNAVGLGAHYGRILPAEQHPHRPGIHPPRAYDKAAHYILDHLEEGDVVIHASQSTWLAFYWYGFKGRPHYVGGINAEFVEFIEISHPVNTSDEELRRLWPRVMDTLTPGHRRIWYVLAEWERAFLPGNAAAVWRWLDCRFMEVEQTAFRGIDVLLYLTPEHADYRRAMERDRDTSVSAHLLYEHDREPYHKIVPDENIVLRTLEERKGNLTLRFDVPAVVSGDEAMRPIRFVLENHSAKPVVCDIHLMASDQLLTCAAFDRTDPESNTWYTGVMYMPHPPPATYNVGTLSGNLRHGGGAVRKQTAFETGVYIPYLYTSSPWNIPEYVTAPATVYGDEMLLLDGEAMPFTSPAWRWVRGAPLHIEHPKSIALTIDTQPLPGEHPGYTNAAFMAFVNAAHLDGEQQKHAAYPVWPGETIVPANDAVALETTIAAAHARVDIWAFEQAEAGGIYNIYRIFDQEITHKTAAVMPVISGVPAEPEPLTEENL